MFRKKLFTVIALTAVVSAILAIAIPADAKNNNISASESETVSLDTTEEITEKTAELSGDSSDGNSFYKEDTLPAAGVAAALKDGTEFTEYSEHAQTVLEAGNDEEAEAEELPVLVEDIIMPDLYPEEVQAEEISSEDSLNPVGMPSSDIAAKEGAEKLAVLNSHAACIAGDYVHLRKEASPYSEPIGVFYKNAAATIIGEEGDWYLIQSGSITGYVLKTNCVIGEEAKEIISEATTTTGVVDSENLALRMAPDMSSATIEILPKEEILNVVQKFGDWAYVETADGENGFVFAPYLTIESQTLTALSNGELDEQEKEQIRKEQEEKALQSVVYSASNGLPSHFVGQNEGNEKGRELIEFAVQFVGNPYVRGGSSLTDGADCSGFVMAVYDHFGITLTHSTEIDQTEGIAVESIETAEPGDIICYQGHVALYMGDGLIVHAAGAATGIRIAPACYTDIITIRRIFVED